MTKAEKHQRDILIKADIDNGLSVKEICQKHGVSDQKVYYVKDPSKLKYTYVRKERETLFFKKVPVYEPKEKKIGICRYCNKIFIRTRSGQQYCSRECRIKSRHDTIADKNHSRTLSYICKNCGKGFTHWRKGMQFCCHKCGNKYKEHKHMNEAEWVVHLNNISIKPQEYLNKNNINADYVSGWKGVDHSCIVRCKACGSEYEAKMGAVRKGRITPCPTCESIKKKQRELLKADARAKAIAEAKAEKDRKEQERIVLRESKKRTAICDICGKQFITYKSKAKRCSIECTRVYQNSFSSRRKDERLTNVKRDKGITVRSLMLRDNGICYICNQPCNLEDYRYNDKGAFIAGDNYPSVEHIIPISKGGTDTWDNVRLAHRRCNYLKGDKFLLKTVKNMEQFSIF